MGRGGCVNQEGRCETWSNAEKVFSVGLRDESHILPIAWNAFLPGSTIGRGGNHFHGCAVARRRVRLPSTAFSLDCGQQRIL